MKRTGSSMEYSQERMKHVMQLHDEYIATAKYIRMNDLYAYITQSATPRFFVSEERTVTVISCMMRGMKLKRMRPLKKEMFREIYKRVITLKKLHPQWTIRQLCAEAIRQPAPKLYLTEGSIKIMVCKIRKQWIAEKMKKLRPLPR